MADSSSSKQTKPLVVITGASSGIGEACAQSFSAAGHPLLLVARRLDRMQALNLPNTICAQVDVTDRPKLKEAIDGAVAKYGPVDCLVNNAGVMLLGKVQTQDPEEWQKMFDVNLMGVLNGTHLVLPSMSKQNPSFFFKTLFS
jgi:NADP-dependent 3-hydroxy acid dehydrogenase YdfG